MTAARRIAFALAFGPMLTGGRSPAASTLPALPPATVLARYDAALASLAKPKAVSFDYSVEQLGLRNLMQTHRVYRAGRNERDEIVNVDGYTLSRRSVRILANRTDRYDIARLAPKRDAYTFAFVTLERGGSAPAYVFKTDPHAAGSFAVRELVLDGRSFLPVSIRFKIAGAGARGSGELRYGRSGKFWLISEARVVTHLTSGATARERIHWSNYQFPSALPPSTFEAPRPLAATPPPEPLPVP